MKHLSIYMSKLENYQNLGYEYIIHKIREEILQSGSEEAFKTLESFGYTLLQKPLEALNMLYPSSELQKDENIDVKDLIGKTGLYRVMSFDESYNPPKRTNFKYRSEEYGRIFAPDNIRNYSAKISAICDSIINSEGVVLIYSQFN